MESTQKKIRYKILIAKCQVNKVEDGQFGTRCLLTLPQGITLDMDLSFRPDVKVGDVLSIYTEVYAHAQSGTASVQ